MGWVQLIAFFLGTLLRIRAELACELKNIVLPSSACNVAMFQVAMRSLPLGWIADDPLAGHYDSSGKLISGGTVESETMYFFTIHALSVPLVVRWPVTLIQLPISSIVAVEPLLNRTET